MKKRMIKIYVSEEFYKDFIFKRLAYYKSFNKYFNKLIADDLKLRNCVEKWFNDLSNKFYK